MIHPDKTPLLVIADEAGKIREFPHLAMAGMANGHYFQPELEDLIPLPEGSELFSLPDRIPVGTDIETGEPLLLTEDPDFPEQKVQAVAAFMAPAHTTVHTAAYQTEENGVLLPLFAYSAVGWYKDSFWVAGFRSDLDERQDFHHFRQSTINRRTRKKLEKYKNNRLIQHLGTCCLTYHCPAARNYFMGRWEAPLPTSPSCNARCVGCISLQPSGCCSSTQERITFVPSAQEISEIAIPHLNNAQRPVVSFGQGCEGEPLLQAQLLEQAVTRIRKATSSGTINLNSNGSLPEAVERISHAGLDSIRISLNSAQELYYNRYYNPVNYAFSDVLDSIKVMKKNGKFVSLNYFVFPGLTDTDEETEALCHLIEQTKPDLIQLRNLNMDPEWYTRTLEVPENLSFSGIRNWKNKLERHFPGLKFGYYNPPLSADT